jgi:hypothetical protein
MLLIGYKNTTDQTIPALGLIDFGSVYHENSKTNCYGIPTFAGTSVAPKLNYRGFYHITAVVTFTAVTAGDVTLQVLENGDEVPGILGTVTVTTPTTESNTVTLDFYVLVGPSIVNVLSNAKTVSIQSTAAITITNAVLNISKEV